MKTLILITLFTPLLSFATPSKFSTCEKSIAIEHIDWGSGVIFNETCDQAYVLPPKVGSMTIAGIARTGNLDLVCDQYNDIEEAMSSTTELLKIYSKRIERHAKRIQEYEEMLEEGLIPDGMTIEDVKEEMAELEEKAEETQIRYIDMWSRLKNLKAFYARTEGGTGKFQMESRYNELIEAYSNENPHISFVRIPLEQSYLMINEKAEAKEDPHHMPMEAVLSISAPGIGALPLLKNIREESDEPQPLPEIPGSIFTDSLSGNIRLSAIGICPLLDSGDLPDTINMKDLETYVSANVVYQYHVQAQRKHTIEFNLGQLAKRIEKSSKKGGFFSRKNVHSLIEKTESKKWIRFETFENDPTFTYSEEYKRELKQKFLNDVLIEVAYVSFGEQKYPSVAVPTEKSGAAVAGDALGKCPHLYCQVGMYALKFLDATFGSKTAISEFIRTRDVWAKETVDQKKMVPYFGSYTFE